MKKIIFAAAATAFISFQNASFAGEISITGECVYLDELTAPSVAHTKVTCGIAPGEERTFSKQAIQNYLARSGIKATVKNDVTVIRTGEKLSREDIISRIEKEYKDAYPDTEIIVDQIRLPKEIYAEKQSDFSVKIDVSKFGGNYAEIHNGFKRSSVYFYAKAFKNGLVAAERIRAGESMEGKLRSERIEVTNLRSSLITDAKGLIASKMIGPGRPVTEELAAPMPALKKGQPVRIVFNNGSIKIETAGVIETDAFLGKTVQVRNVASQKVITANYVGAGIVEASF